MLGEMVSKGEKELRKMLDVYDKYAENVSFEAIMNVMVMVMVIALQYELDITRHNVKVISGGRAPISILLH